MPTAHSVLIAGVLATVMWVSAGSLTPPPGPVSPTMKNLLDVEPRTAIRNDFVNITPIVISSPGSYYLAEDVDAIFGQHGITIDASHVTLDLNGFTVRGNLEVGSIDGIHINPERDYITIKNGTIRDFLHEGIDGFQSDGCVAEDVRVLNNGSHGMYFQQYARIKDCIAINNKGNGIYVVLNTIVTGCMTVGNGTNLNDGDSGIRVVAQGGLVYASTAVSNTGYGIRLGTGGMVSASMAHSNVNNFGIFIGAQGFVHGSSSTGNETNNINGFEVDCYIGP